MTTRSFAARPLRMTRSPSIEIAGLDHLRNDRAVCRHGHHDLPRLVGDDGGGGHQQGRRRMAEGHAQPRELPGRDGEVRIGHRRARMDRPAAAVHRVVDEVERAVAVEMPVAVQADGDVVVRRGAAMGLLVRRGNRTRSCRNRDRSGRARRSSPAASSGSCRPGCRSPGCRLRRDARRCAR